jgi:hypothetical protein
MILRSTRLEAVCFQADEEVWTVNLLAVENSTDFSKRQLAKKQQKKSDARVP